MKLRFLTQRCCELYANIVFSQFLNIIAVGLQPFCWKFLQTKMAMKSTVGSPVKRNNAICKHNILKIKSVN